MTPQEAANAILLRQTGELSPEKTAELDDYLSDHPDAREMDEAFSVLQNAGRQASRLTVPPVNELTLESIRKASNAQPRSKRRPWLALAAALVLLLACIPVLMPPATSPALVDSAVVSERSRLTDSEDMSAQLNALEKEIAAWSDASTQELLKIEDEAYWAEHLLNTEESS